MPAIILPFERRDSSGSVAIRGHAAETEPPRQPPLHPFAVAASRLTSRNIAHRWAMLSHLTRQDPRRAPDPIR